MRTEDSPDFLPPTDIESLTGVIVAARYNDVVVQKLIEGARVAFERSGGSKLYLVRVPGALEIPLALQTFFETQEVDFGVALGCVIRGETSHYDLVIQESLRGCMEVSLDFSMPVGHGILTVENMEQALDRAGGRVGNKGSEALYAALELIRIQEEEPLLLLGEDES